MVTRPFSMCRMARRRMKGSQTSCISIAERTRVKTPARSRASCRARALITVASMPMWSAETRSIPWALSDTPRKMLPPPTTAAISRPMSWTSLISVAR